MAELEELYELQSNPDLTKKVKAAMQIEAMRIYKLAIADTTRVDLAVFADAVTDDPEGFKVAVVWMLLALNETATVANITGATKAQIVVDIQTVVGHKYLTAD